MFEKKFHHVQKKMELRLEEIRDSFQHRGDRGTVSENEIKAFLTEYLPPYNRVGSGEIIDTAGNQSTQLDIIITNEYHPHLNNLDGPEIFIAEGISGVGEVKTKLNSQDVTTLINSCIRYKKIKPKIQQGAMLHTSNMSDTKRFVEHRPYFIFAYESQLTIETIHQKLTDYYAANSTPVEHQIDAVFCLDRGVIWNFGDGTGTLQWKVSGNSIPGLQIPKKGKEGVLFDFMTWISYSMPKISLPSPPIQLYLQP